MRAPLLRIVRAVRFWWSRAPAAKRRLVQAQQIQQDYRIQAEEAQFREDQAAMIRKAEADEYANMVAACDRALTGVGDQRIGTDRRISTEETHVPAAMPYMPEEEDEEQAVTLEQKQRA